MNIRPRIDSLTPELVGWRRHLHAHPELAYQEKKTAAFVAAKLRAFGLEVHEGIGGTGVVGVLRRGNGPMVALRADMRRFHQGSTCSSQTPARPIGKARVSRKVSL